MRPTLYVEAMPDDEAPEDDTSGAWAVHCDGHEADWHREASTAELALTLADQHGNSVHDGTYLLEFTL